MQEHYGFGQKGENPNFRIDNVSEYIQLNWVTDG